MIANQQERESTSAWVMRFRKAIDDLDARVMPRVGVHPRLLQAERDALQSQLADLEAELAEYDLGIRSGPECRVMTEADLVAAGYKKFHDAMRAYPHALGDWYRASYQKKFTDDVGTRYFITVAHGVSPQNGDRAEYPFFEPTEQFQRGDISVNVTAFRFATVEGMEAFFLQMWSSMKFDYYERNEETA